MSDTKKVRINLTEEWSQNYVVEVPREMTPAEIEDYVYDGLSEGKLDMDAVRDCGDYECTVKFVEVVKTEAEKLLDNIEKAREQCKGDFEMWDVYYTLEQAREYIINAEKNKKEE